MIVGVVSFVRLSAVVPVVPVVSDVETPLREEPQPLSTAPLELPAPVPPAAIAAPPNLWDHDHAGHYLAWYGGEYAAIALVGGLFLAGVNDAIPVAPALIGPRFDLNNPDVTLLFDPRLNDVIGRPMLKEKVPEGALAGGAAAVLLGVAGLDFWMTSDVHRTHGLVLGGVETVVGTLVLTEALKLSFGRLRPDFRERWLRAACAGNVKAPDGLECSSVSDGFAVSAADVRYGMESFVSGHSSSSFAVATFASLWVGSTLIWNQDRPSWGPAVGALVAGSLYSAAGLIAASRVSDDRHHVEDVVVGAAAGATIGAAVFLMHFDVDGRARRRAFSVVPTTAMGASGSGHGLALVGAF